MSDPIAAFPLDCHSMWLTPSFNVERIEAYGHLRTFSVCRIQKPRYIHLTVPTPPPSSPSRSRETTSALASPPSTTLSSGATPSPGSSSPQLPLAFCS
ncbi:hypothetical protein BC938DRAFT_480260 [Jimgerdemannia flammicorona]|uniref:Uncharacterized protein n=1 Tax=Jimgerdemannia flammicorona TaxID=994334 RepID=A0A433QXC6_9FUNG|nr:hypothetical protein BC938DRAFT_480260 [Jimgerdemannia flammicorona]